MWYAALAAAVGTAIWAVQLSKSTSALDDVRYALIGAGIIALCSLAVVPPCRPPSSASTGLSFVLIGYQLLITCAVQRGGSLMQALINCNVVFVAIHRHVFVVQADNVGMLVAATGAAALSAAVLAVGQF